MDIRLTEEQREILSGRICPYCHVPTEYKNSIEVYGVDYGMIYYCPQCGAYVGVHKGTDRQRVDWQTPSCADVRLKRTDILMNCTNVD